ncbi:unnamed protein product [Nesidiocoris tenuis]|uniref:Uncharacterized protein n=1 Tax=Nesidiocoris tenuis TaxID=355587 RepID=A0A6H5H8M8_9HEMI|nr:unnamed protein product [Nesidiocoris tenuis]
MKKVLNFVKGKKDDKGPSKMNPQISVEITNPSGQKIPSDDEHIIGLQMGFGYSIDVNGKDKSMLKIHKAAWFGNLDKLKLYAKKGDVNVLDSQSRTCLHLAVAQGHTEVACCDHRDIVELLIKFGANVQVLDRERRTPLMLAARNGLTSIIKVLLENGALLETADSNGWTAEDYAQFGGHHDLIELLETKKKEVSLDQSDKLSVQSSDQSEHVNFEETSLESRKSLLTLGNLKKSYEAGSNELIVSLAEPAPSSLSPSGDIPADMRLSPEPLSLAPTPERRTRSPLERHPSVDLPSDSDSPLQGLSNEDLNSDLGHPDIAELPKDATLNDFSKINHNVITDLADLDKPSNTANNNIFNSSASSKDQGCSRNPTQEDNAYSIESSASYDNLDGRNNQENELAGVSTSLDNIDYENGKSLSIEIVQSTGHLDDTLSITTTKNIFRECHSLELLEAEIGDTRSYKNSKRHHRNKSITLTGQPQLWKSVSTLPKTCSFDRGSIDAQLMCYDEALRQLAKVNKPAEAKDAQMNTSPVKAADPEPKREETAENSIKSLDQIEILDRVNSASPDSYHGRMSAEFQTPTDEELEFLERENFPPPPIYFLQNEDSELCQLDCDDKSIQIDVLPMPISMLTPIKETQLECDSLSVAETIENEHSISEIHSEAMPPNHFNVEVIVNSKTPEPSQSLDDAINLPDAPDITEASLIVDDVFTEDTTLAEPYDKYFVDLKALEMVPSAVDFSKIVFPADSPSPKKSKKIRGSNTGKAASIPNQNSVLGKLYQKTVPWVRYKLRFHILQNCKTVVNPRLETSGGFEKTRRRKEPSVGAAFRRSPINESEHGQRERSADCSEYCGRSKTARRHNLLERQLRTDLDLEVMDSQRSTMSDFATKMDLDRIRCTQNENFSFLKMKEEVISETQNFLMNKLGEINTLIQRQSRKTTSEGIIFCQLRDQSQLRDQTELRNQSQLRVQTQLRDQSQLRDQTQLRDRSQLRVQNQLRAQNSTSRSTSTLRTNSALRSKSTSSSNSTSRSKLNFEININFEIKLSFEIKVNFEINVNFKFKLNFEINVNFKFKVNFEFKLYLEIKVNFEFKINYEYKLNFDFKLNLEIKVNFEINVNFDIDTTIISYVKYRYKYRWYRKKSIDTPIYRKYRNVPIDGEVVNPRISILSLFRHYSYDTLCNHIEFHDISNVVLFCHRPMES